MPVDLAPELLEILACPNCHSALAVDDDREELVCVASDCGLAYPVVDGIPVMLVDEARRPGKPDEAPSPGQPEEAGRAGGGVESARRLDDPDQPDQPGTPGAASAES
jgi:uncharacterized protein